MFVQYVDVKLKHIRSLKGKLRLRNQLVSRRELKEVFCLEIGKSFSHKGEKFQIIKIYRDCFLATDSHVKEIKRFPILQIIK